VRPVLLAALAALSTATPALADPVIGRPAPALAGATFAGRPFDLAALRGRVVVLNFWASWCAPCREEMPALDGFQRQWASRGVLVVGLSTDKPPALPLAGRIADGVGYPILAAANARADGFGMPRELPATVIIDPAGIVRAIVTGEGGLLTQQRLAALVQPYLPRRSAAL